MLELNKIHLGNALNLVHQLDKGSIDTCVTSPPYYGLRDYGIDGQLGLEQTPEEYVDNLVEVFSGVRNSLTDYGTLWLNIGDSSYNYRPGKGQSMPKQTVASSSQDLPQTCARRGNKLVGLKEKDLIGIPWMLAFALRADGWYLRQDIIWAKGNPMPESVKDRCTRSHEYLFLLTKSRNYYFDYEAIREKGVIPAGTKGAKGSVERYNTEKVNSRPPEYKIYDGMRNKRDVWHVNNKPYKSKATKKHYAVMPEALVHPCILAGCPQEGTVLDPFSGMATVAVVAKRLRRNFIGFELNPEYLEESERRICLVS